MAQNGALYPRTSPKWGSSRIEYNEQKNSQTKSHVADNNANTCYIQIIIDKNFLAGNKILLQVPRKGKIPTL